MHSTSSTAPLPLKSKNPRLRPRHRLRTASQVDAAHDDGTDWGVGDNPCSSVNRIAPEVELVLLPTDDPGHNRSMVDAHADLPEWAL